MENGSPSEAVREAFFGNRVTERDKGKKFRGDNIHDIRVPSLPTARLWHSWKCIPRRKETSGCCRSMETGTHSLSKIPTPTNGLRDFRPTADGSLTHRTKRGATKSISVRLAHPADESEFQRKGERGPHGPEIAGKSFSQTETK